MNISTANRMAHSDNLRTIQRLGEDSMRLDLPDLYGDDKSGYARFIGKAIQRIEFFSGTWSPSVKMPTVVGPFNSESEASAISASANLPVMCSLPGAIAIRDTDFNIVCHVVPNDPVTVLRWHWVINGTNQLSVEWEPSLYDVISTTYSTPTNELPSCKLGNKAYPTPFSLQRAIGLDPIVTRMGLEAAFVGYYPQNAEGHQVVALVDGLVRVYNANGVGEDGDALMMAKMTRTYYVNVWADGAARYHETLEAAQGPDWTHGVKCLNSEPIAVEVPVDIHGRIA